jgi:Txe/YoeB family toxin of Txe-Axe toxin-antitoxin module
MRLWCVRNAVGTHQPDTILGREYVQKWLPLQILYRSDTPQFMKAGDCIDRISHQCLDTITNRMQRLPVLTKAVAIGQIIEFAADDMQETFYRRLNRAHRLLVYMVVMVWASLGHFPTSAAVREARMSGQRCSGDD